MEISPIAGIRVAPVKTVRSVEPVLTTRFEIEPLTNQADGSCSHSNGSAGGAEEFDRDSEELEEIVGEADVEFTSASSQISIFA